MGTWASRVRSHPKGSKVNCKVQSLVSLVGILPSWFGGFPFYELQSELLRGLGYIYGII